MYGRAQPEWRRRKLLPRAGQHGVDRWIGGKGATTGEETERSLGTRAGGRMDTGSNETLGARAREQEQEASEAAAAAMEERVNKTVKGCQKDPEAVSKKTEEAIKRWE
jgi:hypothetical protein